MAIQPSSNGTLGTKLALQFPTPPVLKSSSVADLQVYANALADYNNTMNKVLQRTFQQLGFIIDTKADKT